ncbi:DNA-binding transcriptional regulator, XRE-family HTH domain [Virgibacillus subterraneus]|uniref:DNA-binding transcriptional regulator, XRE-family HTH domain n=2 Tax=Virgibacillus TaxID=84406 RepID=A0A1H1EM21_9BACI|nr:MULTISPECIES: helix-turn-helix transcriptional regulator [Virgibacillus]SDQ89620.1 DNA-binding transcriptional regulator, XRE-family HTH domain [Virgibacillus salinus]SEQ45084.1 DNA-binding transcriptional regulator, XRE-family HTH domain [Virgibacillus subterraneus]
MKREWLIRLRKSKQFTQEKVALDAYIDRAFYSQIETGKRNPSFNIALNIAKVLNFDPMKFFQDNLNIDQRTPSYRHIPEYFRSMNRGDILYLFNNFDNYLEHVVTFLITGVHQDSYCIIIEQKRNYIQIQQRLENFLTKSEIEDHIYFIDQEVILQNEPKDIVGIFHKLQDMFKEENPVRIWMFEEQYTENDWIAELGSYLDLEEDHTLKVTHRNILFLRAYDSSLISAGLHIKKMHCYSYLMTDSEIVDSPFYRSCNKSFIFPSLFIQVK